MGNRDSTTSVRWPARPMRPALDSCPTPVTPWGRVGLSHALVRTACALLTVAAALLEPPPDDAWDRDVSLTLDRIFVLREICRC